MSNKLTPACKEKRKKIQNPLYFHPCRETNTDFVLESSSALTKQGSARTNVSLIKLCVHAHVIVCARTWQTSNKSKSPQTSAGHPACPQLSRQSRSPLPLTACRWILWVCFWRGVQGGGCWSCPGPSEVVTKGKGQRGSVLGHIFSRPCEL